MPRRNRKTEHPSPHYAFILEAVDLNNGCLMKEIYQEYVKISKRNGKEEIVVDVFYRYVKKLEDEKKLIKIERGGKTGISGRTVRLFI